jgi:hypothetical protein
VEVHRIAAEEAALAELLEFHTLNLELLDTLAEYDLAAVLVMRICHDGGPMGRVVRLATFCRILERVARVVALGDDADATGEQRDGGAGLGGLQEFLVAIAFRDRGAECTFRDRTAARLAALILGANLGFYVVALSAWG